jgi:hypothetical protein
MAQLMLHSNRHCASKAMLRNKLRVYTMKLHTIIFVVALLCVCGCASHSRSRDMVEKFYREPAVPPAYTNAWTHASYVIAHIYGFNDFMALRGSQPDWTYGPGGVTLEIQAAERDGYLAGVTAAFDAWQQYSRTNQVSKK